MCCFPSAIRSAAFILVLHFSAPLLAQQVAGVDAWEWSTLDADFRQAIIDEMAARRGLAGGIENVDELIRSTEDIREVLRLSCELSGACADGAGRATLGENLISFPDYAEEQGLRNAEIILNRKRGHAE